MVSNYLLTKVIYFTSKAIWYS